MPASEQTWRDQKLLHRIFAVSGVLLLVSTLWMFAADHAREWKLTQSKSNEIEIMNTRWRIDQEESDAVLSERERLQAALQEVRSQPFSAELMDAFKEEVRQMDPDRSFDALDELVTAVNTAAEEAGNLRLEAGTSRLAAENAATEAGDARQAAERTADESQRAALEAEADRLAAAADEAESEAADKEAAAAEAEGAVGPLREKAIAALERIVKLAREREDLALRQRKFKNADFDAARAALDIGVRDEISTDEMDRLQAKVFELREEVSQLSLEYEAAADHRKKLQDYVSKMTAAEDELQKRIEDNQAEVRRLETSLRDRRANFIQWYGLLPLPGKRVLDLPILDAFNSRLRIENLWSDGLDQENGSFGRVRRFDRCTTCHKLIDRTMPGSAVPAYPGESHLRFRLRPPSSAVAELAASEPEASAERRLELSYGIMLADEGLLDPNDVTIKLVQFGSPAAAAAQEVEEQLEPRTASEISQALLQPRATRQAGLDGLQVGDVIVEVDGDPVWDRDRTLFRLLDSAEEGRSVTLTIRRGLPNPYASHPRLDLFVGSTSPHRLGDFACTVCHDGQGSATAFTWASHSPNDPAQREQWARDYGWFDNPHWIYPMYPRRFAQSACLKCHVDVTELEPSARFPDPPAPEVLLGYNLVRKLGCYGCHEINGYDGPHRRVGPDMRLEPNFFAAAQQLQVEPGYEKLSSEQQDWVQQLIFHPERDAVRHQLYKFLADDATKAQVVEDQQKRGEEIQPGERPVFGDTVHAKLTPLLKDIEVPGNQRKVGPSLRFVGKKLDEAFLYDWIREPAHFRPSTRMPQFFDLWKHLEAESREIAERNEPIEILGIVRYLLDRSQPFSYLDAPAGITPSSPQEQVARGKVQFQERGCLACHAHRDFPDVEQFSNPDEIVQGPDLSRVGEKFDPARNPDGPQWLYSWIKKPNLYHVRTFMPDVFLDPIEHKDVDGNVTHVTDPAADIVAYLLADSRGGWQPKADTITQLDESHGEALDALALELLKEAFYEQEAQRFLEKGIPPERRSELKGAEVELVVSAEQLSDPASNLSASQKLVYVGRKTIAKYGCYACHDIPGFEDAKPIATGLADWGRKDPSRLAFEHITHYLHGHGGGHAAHGGSNEEVGDEAHAPSDSEYPEFYRHQVEAGHRVGFLYQKLREPRSYDFLKTENKRYGERLRMPQFGLDDYQREAIITFVIGLVADPPRAKYIFQADPHMAAIIDGRKALDKYNCGGCHILEAERWEIAFPADRFGDQPSKPTFPFVLAEFTPDELKASAAINAQNKVTATITGMPTLGNDGLPVVFDDEGTPLKELGASETFDPRRVEYAFDLWKPTALDGHAYQVGEVPLTIPAGLLGRRHPVRGGNLTRYLLPHVVSREQQVNANAKGSEAWSWLAPPLVDEGTKANSDWLYEFLLSPHPIRPAVVLRMPQFNMSPKDATDLVNYFAAIAGADYPYEFSRRQLPAHLERAASEYRDQLHELGVTDVERGRRLEDAMKIVTNNNYCIKCHSVADFEPKAADRAKAPNLAHVYRRLRSDYVRNWIAKPAGILPYTSMPVNITYDPNTPFLGTTVPQDLYHGNSIEQVDALVDLLMNFDKYAQQRSLVAPLVEQNVTAGATSATTGGDGAQ